MSVIKGSDLMLFLTVNGVKKSIAFATNHTITISADTKETSTKDNGGIWLTSEAGMLSWSCSSENLMGNPMAGIGFDDLFDLMVKRQPIEGVFALEGDSDKDNNVDKLGSAPSGGWTPKTGDGYIGKVIITNLEKSAPNGDNATMKVDFTGVGELKKVTGGTTTENK